MRYALSFIAGVLFTLLSSKLWSVAQRDTYTHQARAKLNFLEVRLSQLKDKCGKYPSQDIGLNALIKPELINCQSGAFIEGGSIPKDPLEKDFVYLENQKDIYVLSSIKESGFVKIEK